MDPYKEKGGFVNRKRVYVHPRILDGNEKADEETGLVGIMLVFDSREAYNNAFPNIQPIAMTVGIPAEEADG
jgi:hypothetical protein